MAQTSHKNKDRKRGEHYEDWKSKSPYEGILQVAREKNCIEEKKSPFQIFTMQEIMSGDYKSIYFCNGVIAKDQPTIIGGPFKNFKSTIGWELGVCLATGKQFLNHFDVPKPVKVCFFSGEGGLSVIQDLLRRIGEAKEIDISTIENLILCDRLPRIDNEEQLIELGKLFDQYKPVVAFFDPTYMAMGGAETSNVFSMGERLNKLTELCKEKGVTPVLLHHLREGRTNHYAPATLNELSQAGFAEWAGQWILLSRRERYDPDDPTHRLWVSFGGRTGHGSAWALDVYEGTNENEGGRIWDTKLKRQDEIQAEKTRKKAEKQEEKLREEQAEFNTLCEKVLEFIKKHPGGVTKQNVKDRNCCPARQVNAIIASLEEKGAIEQCKVVVPTGTATRKTSGYKAVSSNSKKPFDLNPGNP